MNCRAITDAGVCGMRTTIVAKADDLAAVSFEIDSDCEKIRRLAEALALAGFVDAYAEVGAGCDGVIMSAARATLRGCCSACAAAIAVFKAMQVAAGLALPRDIHIQIMKE